MANRSHLAAALLAVLALSSNAWAHDEPIPVERKYSKESIVICFMTKTKTLRAREKELKSEAIALQRARKSVAPIVLQQRRIAEDICSVEAQCVADEISENKELIYGDTYARCLGHSVF